MVHKTTAFKRKSANQRRQDLIEAGIECLGKGGMTAFTIDQICSQAGVSRGLVNHHFTSKDDLLVAIYAHMTNYLVVEGDSQLQVASFIERSFDDELTEKSNLRAWLSIWGQVASNPALKKLHQQRYLEYRQQVADAFYRLGKSKNQKLDSDQLARQLVALIDGLWLEYCLHSEGFSLAAAKADCYQFLQSQGVIIEADNQSYLDT